jgi:predicted NBD/HSP70 family sugar kinase
MQNTRILEVELGGSGGRIFIVCGRKIGPPKKITVAKLTPESLVRFIAGQLRPGIVAIAVSTSGFVTKEGAIEHSTNTHFPPNVPLRQMIEDTTGLPAIVANDLWAGGTGSSIVFPELAGQRYNCVNFGGGVGQCACENGRVISPCEFGHSRIVDSIFARRCACGKQGCAEAYIGGESMRREVEFTTDALGIRIPKGMHPCAFLDERFRDEELWAVDIYRQFAFAAGVYMANFQLANPAPVYTLRGSMARKALHLPGVMDWVEKQMYSELSGESWRPKFLFIPPPKNGDPNDYDAILGAASMAMQLLK